MDTRCPNAGDILCETRTTLEDGLKSAVEQKTVGSVGSAGRTAEGEPLSELLEVFRRDAES